MNKHRHNQSGFSAIELILIILVVGLLGTVGWLVYKTQNKAPVSTPTSSTQTSAPTANTKSQANQTTTEKKTTTKTVTLGTASYSFELPNGWAFKEITTLDTTSEKLVYIIDPTNKLQLETQILSSPATDQSIISLKSFTGIDAKTYYMHGYKGNSTAAGAYELLHISSCSDKHCNTKINDGYFLNLAIRSADLSTPTKIDNLIIGDIIAIVQSVKLGQ